MHRCASRFSHLRCALGYRRLESYSSTACACALQCGANRNCCWWRCPLSSSPLETLQLLSSMSGLLRILYAYWHVMSEGLPEEGSQCVYCGEKVTTTNAWYRYHFRGFCLANDPPLASRLASYRANCPSCGEEDICKLAIERCHSSTQVCLSNRRPRLLHTVSGTVSMLTCTIRNGQQPSACRAVLSETCYLPWSLPSRGRALGSHIRHANSRPD